MSIIDGIKSNAKTAKWVGFLLIIAGIAACVGAVILLASEAICSETRGLKPPAANAC